MKRVEIPKADDGVRKLDILTVRDRVVKQAVRSILEPIFDKEFHPLSYGYRKKRSCHHAISKAQLFIGKYKRKWIFDMDLAFFFDLLDHDFIIKQVQRKVIDCSISNLLRIIRYADDILILCGSERSAKHALEVAENYLKRTYVCKRYNHQLRSQIPQDL